MDNARFWQLLAVFVAVNAVAAALNHIDDTDETYGYYEPLHFMMYGYGFQTWEYSHEFGLRSYVFLLPMALVGQALQAALSLSKVQTFYALRLVLGTFTAVAESAFVSAIDAVFGPSMGTFTFVFMLTSAGVLYAATSFLPSAVIMR